MNLNYNPHYQEHHPVFSLYVLLIFRVFYLHAENCENFEGFTNEIENTIKRDGVAGLLMNDDDDYHD